MNEIMKTKMLTISTLLNEIKLGKQYISNDLKIISDGANDYYIIVTTPGHETKELKTLKEMTKILKIVL